MAEARGVEGQSQRQMVERFSRFWGVVTGIGGAMFVLGIVMLFHVVTTTIVLAVIVGLYLIVWGIARIGEAHRSDAAWPSYLLSAVLVAGGVVVVVRPTSSLHLLAVIIGATLVASGAVRLITGMMASEQMSTLAVLLGVASIAVGFVLIVWPGITIWVIGIVVGIRAIISGAELLLTGGRMRRLARAH